MSTAPEPASEQEEVHSHAARQQANTNHLWDKAASPSPRGGTTGTSGDSAKGLQKVCRRQHVPVKENSLYGPGSLRTFTVTS